MLGFFVGQKKLLYKIPERFLRQLWRYRQFSSTNLRTTDNQPIEIISVGKLNQNGGPDFTNAVIRINGIVYRGDVEIHQRNSEWFEHRHHEDAKYNTVILHVVLHKDRTSLVPVTSAKRTIPVFALGEYLTSDNKLIWEKMILNERAERMKKINCFNYNESIDASVITSWVEKLAEERMELKIQRFEERLKELIEEQRLKVKEPFTKYGEIPFGVNPEDLPPPTLKYSLSDFRNINLWEQLLYEGIMEALGYSKNQMPFLKLGRNLMLEFFKKLPADITSEKRSIHIEAIMFGVAGLLPTSEKNFDEESQKYVLLLKRLWNKYRRLYNKATLSESEWQFFRLRPRNFPTVRIAGASKLVERFLQEKFLKLIGGSIRAIEQSTKNRLSRLIELFIIKASGYWSSHFRFGEISKVKLKTLIGKDRAYGIILNVVIPISLLYARIFKDKVFRNEVLGIYVQCPPQSQNVITRIITSQLTRSKLRLSSAKLQQGAIQCYKFYCIEGKCNECNIGKIIFKS